MNGKAFRLALLLDDYCSEYSDSLIKGAAEYCQEKNGQLTAFSVGSIGAPFHNYDYQLYSPLSLIGPANFDGVVFSSATQQLTKEQLSDYFKSFGGLPCLSIGTDVPGFACLLNDCKPGLYSLVTHLIDVHRCKKIALLGVHHSSEAVEREAVVRQACTERGVPFDEDCIIYAKFTYASAVRALTEYTKSHSGFDFDAVVALNDDMAFACLDFLRKQAYDRNVIVTGYDNLERASYSKPTLTTVDQRIRKQGFIAARTLHTMISGGSYSRIQIMPSMALFRESCGCVKPNETEVNAVDIDGRKILFSDPSEKSIIGEWYMRKRELQRIIGYQSEKQAAVPLPELRKQLSSGLTQFELSGVAVCLFRKPVYTDGSERFLYKEKMYVFAARDLNTGFILDEKKPDIEFDPKEHFVPNGILDPAAPKYYCVPVYSGMLNYGYIVFIPEDSDLSLYSLLFSTVSSSISMAYSYSQEEVEKVKLSENNRMLSSISQTDEMTHVLNRRGLMLLGQQSVDMARSQKLNGIVAFCDMDGLKKINDTYGHDAGDRAIKAEASVLKATFRSTDIISRLGGDEFVAVVPGMEISWVEQIRKKIDTLCAQWNSSSGELFTISISIGCATFIEYDYSLEKMLKTADGELYVEKRRKKFLRQQGGTQKGGNQS